MADNRNAHLAYLRALAEFGNREPTEDELERATANWSQTYKERPDMLAADRRKFARVFTLLDN